MPHDVAFDDGRQRGGIARDAERAGQHVGGAEREHGDRCRARIGETVHDLVERAVAARGDDAVHAALAFGDEAARIAGRVRREELDGVAARFERPHQARAALATAAAARGRIRRSRAASDPRSLSCGDSRRSRARSARREQSRARRSRPRSITALTAWLAPKSLLPIWNQTTDGSWWRTRSRSRRSMPSSTRKAPNTAPSNGDRRNSSESSTKNAKPAADE